jgi:hypothetical protein
VKRADDFFLQIVLSTKQPKRKIFFSAREHKKSYSQLNSFFFQQAGGTRDRTKEKKETLH